MRRIFFVLTLGLCAAAIAEEQLPLKPIDRDASSDEKRCSEYFYSTTFGGSVAEQIIFAYQSSDGGTKRTAVARKRTVVHIADNLTYEKTDVDYGDGAVFRLTNAEYTKARECLPQPISLITK
jgi:hypothetical protein